MTEFKFVTNPGESPQGLPRVYFTAHSDDRKKFFDDICRQILNKQRCAVFYIEGDELPPDISDYEMQLGEMQLFAVPVTSRLLRTSNRTIDFDVPFAINHHIPILPLIQEKGLDEEFRDRFGELQYLDKNNTDPTAIRYEDKLAKYLEAIITGDELAAQIRAAFDAYIFLSYRKKDRRYAQELMRLIHSNPFCRDIAIWYDEFLTPGENFNDAIQEALEKSKLFALAVTPNLLNEINYVLTTEYPMARSLGKIILPAEMQPADRDKLNEMYEGIPEIIGCGEHERLSERLREAVHEIAVRTDGRDPRHEFFIGLAYLGGVDVEVDHERAVELITGAGEAGCVEAIRKLISMYDFGEGVERDRARAGEWCGRLVGELRSGDDKKALFWALISWGEHLEPRSEAEKEVCLEMLEAARLLGAFEVALAYSKLGDNAADADKDSAREYYRNSVEAVDSIPESRFTEEPYIIWYIIGNLFRAALFEYYHGDRAAADAYFERMTGFSERLYRIERDAFVISDLIDRMLDMGRDNESDEKYPEAIEWYEKALSTAEDYQRRYPEIDLNESEYDCLISLGKLHNKLKEHEKAASYYRRAFTMAEGSIEWYDAIDAFEGLSLAEEALGNTEEAERVYGRIFEAYRSGGVPDEEIPGDIYERMADLEALNGKLEEASAHYAAALNGMESVPLEKKFTDDVIAFCGCYDKAGRIELKLRRPEKAAVYFKKALDLLLSGVIPDYMKAETTALISHGYFQLAEAETAMGNSEKASEYYRKAFGIRSNPIQLSEHYLINIYTAELKAYKNDSYRCMKENIHLDESLAKALDSHDGWAYLAERYGEAAHILSDDDDDNDDDARRSLMIECYRKAVALIEQRLCDGDPEEYYKILAGHYYYLGIYESGEALKREMYESSARCHEKLLNIYLDRGDIKKAARTYEDIARCMESAGDKEAAASIRKNALELVQKDNEAPRTAREKSTLLDKLTEVYRAEEELGNLDEAAAAAEKAIALAEELYEETRDYFLYKKRPDIYYDAGRIEKKRKNHDKAAEYYNKGIFYSEIVLKYYDSGYWYGTYLAYRALGDMAAERGDITEAIEHYKKILALEEISKKPIKLDSEVKYKVLNAIGDMYIRVELFETVGVYYRRAIELLKAAAAGSGKGYDILIVYRRYSELAKAEVEQKRYGTALEYFTEALEYCEQFMTYDPDEQTRYLMYLYGDIARCEKELGLFDSASEHMAVHVSLAEKVYKDDEPSTPDMVDMTYMIAGSFEKGMEHFDKAAEYYRKLVGYREKISRESKDADRGRMIASAYILLAEAERKLKNKTAAREHYRTALKYLTEGPDKDSDRFYNAKIYYLCATVDVDDILDDMLSTAAGMLDDLLKKEPENAEYSEARAKIRHFEETYADYRRLEAELGQLNGLFKKKKRQQCEQALLKKKEELLRLIDIGIF